jgi:hypothetical protein
MRIRFFIFLLLCSAFSSAQSSLEAPEKLTKTAFNIDNLFKWNPSSSYKNNLIELEDEQYLTLQSKALQALMKERPVQLELTFPFANGKDITLLLEQNTITASDFTITDEHQKEFNYRNGLHFQGTVANKKQSSVAISFFDDQVMGLILIGDKNYVLGHINQDVFPPSKTYVLYEDAKMNIKNDFQCHTNEPSTSTHPHQENDEALSISGAKVVKVYFECDHQMYLDKGSNLTNVANYVTGLFNQVALLYRNESIEVQIQKIAAWTSRDPFPSNSSEDILKAFGQRTQNNFEGDLAHFLSTKRSGLGGVAWVNVLCRNYNATNNAGPFAYSNIYNNYSAIPIYSWTVNVVAHEMGHNLGSPHTHACVWGSLGNRALDNCYPVEGNCAPGAFPTNGGTIMSYCHLDHYINFNNGFGREPGNLIRSRINAANCLGTGDSGGNTCTKPTLNQLSASNIGTTTARLNCSASSTNYDWAYRIRGTSDWVNLPGTTLNYRDLTGLMPNTTYEFSAAIICNGEWTDWSDLKTFKTNNTESENGISNDNPCNARTITPTSNCTYNTYSNVNATVNSTYIYSDCETSGMKDIWFKIKIPSEGGFFISTREGTMEDAVMAFYEGTCGNLREFYCTDDQEDNIGNVYAMPYAYIWGGVGNWIYVRIWGYDGEVGSFKLCVRPYIRSGNTIAPGEVGVDMNPDTYFEIENRTTPIAMLNSANLSIMPSLAHESTTVHYQLANDAPVFLQVLHHNGQIMQSYQLGHQASGNHFFNLNTSALPNGIFTIRLITDKQQFTKRMVVAH